MVERWKLLNVDDFVVDHKQFNQSKGGVSCYRVRTVGNHKKETKLTVILAIETGDPRLPDESEESIMQPRIWINIRCVAGK